MNPYFATKFFPASLTLAEEEGIAWCRIGKVATTAWSALFLLLREVPLDTIRAAVASLNIHDLLREKYPSRPSERIQRLRAGEGGGYFSFLVVRHPFLRLVSAYRRLVNIRARPPTFPEFVDHLIRTPPNMMDKLWAPYSKVEYYSR